jgi:hypothetical protein
MRFVVNVERYQSSQWLRVPGGWLPLEGKSGAMEVPAPGSPRPIPDGRETPTPARGPITSSRRHASSVAGVGAKSTQASSGEGH